MTESVNSDDANIKYFYVLDLARFCAAVLVLFWHYQHFGNFELKLPPPISFFFKLGATRGFLAVQFFWLLSGFVIASVYLRKWRGLRIFLQHRIARLYPLHLLTLLIVTCLNVLSTQLIGSTYIYQNFDLRHFIENLLFVPGFFMSSGASFNGPFWSVSLELSCYILFAFSIWIFRGQVHWYIFFSILSLFIVLDCWKLFPDLVVRANVFFFAGVLVYKLLYAQKFKLILLISACLYIFSSFILTHNYEIPIFLRFAQIDQLRILSVMISLLTVCVLMERVKLFSKGYKTMQNLGNLTYSIYLCHVPLQISIMLICNLNNLDIQSIANSPIFFGIYVYSVVILSKFTYSRYELPIRKKIRSFKV